MSSNAGHASGAAALPPERAETSFFGEAIFRNVHTDVFADVTLVPVLRYRQRQKMAQISLSLLSLKDACKALVNGSLVVFPTETFFAVGCDAMNPDAVGAVFSIKKRALNMPLPVVIGHRDCLPRITSYVTDAAAALMDAFWPGPLSIVLPANPEVPELLTANAGRIAVRYSPHPAVLSLCDATDRVLVASSANLSGQPSASRAEWLDRSLLDSTAGVYMEEPLPEGKLPSTVVDVVEKRGKALVRLLRPGAISVEALRMAGFDVVDQRDAEN